MGVNFFQYYLSFLRKSWPWFESFSKDISDSKSPTLLFSSVLHGHDTRVSYGFHISM